MSYSGSGDKAALDIPGGHGDSLPMLVYIYEVRELSLIEAIVDRPYVSM